MKNEKSAKEFADELSKDLMENLRRNVAADKKRREEAERQPDPYQGMHGVCIR